MDNLERITKLEERSKSNTKRIDTLTQEVHDLQKLTNSVAVLAEKISNMSDDIKEIKETVESVEQRPGNALSRIAWIVVTAVCSAGISAFVTYLFAGGA